MGATALDTIYDFLTVALFAGLIGLFLQRSIGDVEDPRPIWQYAVAAIGCAVTNQLGNKGYDGAAIIMLAVTLAFVVRMLDPLEAFRRR